MELAEQGLRVLVVEAGPPPSAAAARAAKKSLSAKVRKKLKQTFGPEPEFFSYFLSRAGKAGRARPVIVRHGRGPGGSSALYSAALGRFRRSDFGDTRPEHLRDTALPNDWPIDYDAFKAAYARAEKLMRVRGECDPTDPDDDEFLLDPPSLSRDGEAVRAIVEKNGYHPYRLHVAVDYVPGCAECFGYRCPIDCKSDGANRALKRAMATGLVQLETDLVVDRVAARDGVATVTVRDTDGRESERQARRVVLSAGALNTPLILERSADLWKDTPRPPMLAKGLMFHVSDIFALQAIRQGGDASPRKWLAIRDLYEDGVANLGDIQSTGTSIGTGTIMQGLRDHASRVLPGRLLLLAEFLRPAAWLVARYLGPQSVYATIVEDMPFASNGVREEQGRIVVSYAIDPELKSHASRMRSRVREISRRSGSAS